MTSTEAQRRAAKTYYARHCTQVKEKRRNMYDKLKHDVSFKAKHNAASRAFYYRKKAEKMALTVAL
jgi:hypothetical protein